MQLCVASANSVQVQTRLFCQQLHQKLPGISGTALCAPLITCKFRVRGRPFSLGRPGAPSVFSTGEGVASHGLAGPALRQSVLESWFHHLVLRPSVSVSEIWEESRLPHKVAMRVTWDEGCDKPGTRCG